MLKHILLLSSQLVLLCSGFSQSISGQVTDAEGIPTAFVALRLFQYNETDSTQVAGASADESGHFSWNEIPAGQYRIEAALVGFENALSPVFTLLKNESKVLPPIVLPTSSALGEVVITARKPLIEIQVDKTVVNVEGTALATGNTVLDILQRAPGVVVTPQEDINLAGKGTATILIDGKPIGLSGTQLASYLRGLSADAIKSIEIIANPSSKYDAAGTGGIINIRLRKNQNLGLKGNTSLAYTQGIHGRLNGGLNLNYRPGTINFFLNASANEGGQSIGQKMDRYQNGKYFDQSSPKLEYWNGKYLKTGLDWYASDRSTVGVMVSGSGYDNRSFGNTITTISAIGNTAPDSTLQVVSTSPSRNQRINYNLNYQYQDTSGHEFTMDIDRISFVNSGKNTLSTQFFNPEFLLLSNNQFRSDLKEYIGIWALKSDYTFTQKSGWKVETGIKVTRSATANSTRGENDFGDGFMPDAGRTNTFHLDENISALYGNVSKSIQKWSFQTGLRAEQTGIKGLSTDIQGGETINPDTAYTGLFPSFFVQYQLAENHQIGLSANRRLQRPNYQDLNPFIWQLDPYTSEQGNPYLRPAYAQSAALKYTYKWAASIELSYTQTTGIIQTIVRSAGNNAWIQPFNLADNKNVSINISSPLPIADWWEGYFWCGIWHNQFTATIENDRVSTEAWGGGCWTGQQFKLGKGFQGELSLWAQFPTTEGVFNNKGIMSLDLGLKKTFLEGKITTKLGVKDVLGTQRWISDVDFAGVQARQRNNWESQAIALELSWNFGNEKVKSRDRKSGNDAINNRIKAGKNQ